MSYGERELLELLHSDLVTEPTRRSLLPRLGPAQGEPRALTPAEFETLLRVVGLFCPAIVGVDLRFVALAIDARLAEGRGDGWRYDALPPDPVAMREGLRRLASAPDLSAAIERLRGGAEDWSFPSELWLSDLCTEIAVNYYSHPLVQAEIGYVGFADAQGYGHIGLNKLEPWETREADPVASPSVARPSWPWVSGASSASRTFSEHDEVDAVIIGTGAGGAPLAARLCAAGLKVVALEAGRHWNPPQEFATDEKSQADIYWCDERLSAGEHPLAFGSNNSGKAVGGTTVHYTGYVPRPHKGDFRIRSVFGVAEDWPFGYEELKPFYEEVEAFLGVSGPSPYPWEPDRQYPLPPLPLNGPAELMQRGCNSLGIRTSPAPNAALSMPYGQAERGVCTNRGFCQAGCSTGAKGSTDVTYIPFALQHGLDLRPECHAVEIEFQGDRVTGVVYLHRGKRQSQSCRNLFLCAGAIETPRLLLANGIGKGPVGKNFMAHEGAQIWSVFEEETRPWKGIPGGLISEEFRRPKDVDFAGGFILQSIGTMPLTYVAQLARGQGLAGQRLLDHMRKFNHVAGINMHGDSLPSPGNYLELSDEKDWTGLAKPRIHYTRTENGLRMCQFAEAIMCDIWAAAGGREFWKYPRHAHTLGTCRMGLNSDESVVSPEGRVHGYQNLFVCDGSVFPTALSSNPAITIMALGLRTADKFLARDPLLR